MYMCVYIYIYIYIYTHIHIHISLSLYVYIYIYTLLNGPDSSVVRGYGLGGGGPEFNPHHVKLSGLQVRPFKVSGGSPVHLRSKHRATGSRTWKEDLLGQQKYKITNIHTLLSISFEALRRPVLQGDQPLLRGAQKL